MNEQASRRDPWKQYRHLKLLQMQCEWNIKLEYKCFDKPVYACRCMNEIYGDFQNSCTESNDNRLCPPNLLCTNNRWWILLCKRSDLNASNVCSHCYLATPAEEGELLLGGWGAGVPVTDTLFAAFWSSIFFLRAFSRALMLSRTGHALVRWMMNVEMELHTFNYRLSVFCF